MRLQAIGRMGTVRMHGGRAMNDNPMVRIELTVPYELAAVLAAKPQYVFSERMYLNLLDILTPDQEAALATAKVHPRPLVFPREVVQA